MSYTGHTQKNGAVSKVNKKFMSHITRAQHIPSAAATVQVSHALPAAPPPPFSQECTSASQSCSSTALDRTCCSKWRQEPSPLATPMPDPTPCDFFLLGVR
jgi:hypothetical protein